MKLSDDTLRQLAVKFDAQKQRLLDMPTPDLSGLGDQARAFLEKARHHMPAKEVADSLDSDHLPDDIAVMPFHEKWPWRGGDLQTIRNNLVGELVDLSPWPATRLLINATDPEGIATQDRLVLNAHILPDSDKPALILIHGFTGCEDSYYIRRSARHFLQAGHSVVRVNLRGAGPGRSFARQEYHAGRTEDLAAILHQLPDNLTRQGMIAVGYSLGGNMLLKYMGEHGKDAGLVAAASVSAPINLRQTADQFQKPRNALYQRYMLKEYKRWVTHDNIAAPIKERIDKASSIYDMDDIYIAWRYGFDGADDYYRQNSSQYFLDDIAKPTLIVHAANDPWIPASSYEPALSSTNPTLTVNLVEGGGHLGFHDEAESTWHDRRLTAFLTEQGL